MTEAAEALETRRALDRSLVRGIAWMGVTRAIAQAITWVVTVTVARLLQPSDYGLVGEASVLLGVLVIVGEFGLGPAVLSQRDLTKHDLGGLHGLAALLGLGATIVAALCAWPLTAFFSEPALMHVVPVLSLNLLLGAIRTVPQAALQRDLEFKTVATIDLTQSLLQALTTFALAWAGYGYWALLIGTLVGSTAFASLLWWKSGLGISRPNWGRLRGAIHVGREVLGSRLAWYGFQNADFAVVGRRFGATTLGAYTFAWNLALLPLEKLASIIVNITPAIFSAARHDEALSRRYVLQISAALLLVILPLTIGTALVAPDLITTVFKSQWTAAIVPLRVLAVYASIRCLDPLWTQLLMMNGDSRVALRQNLLGFVFLPIAFIVGSRWGMLGVAAAWIVVHPLVIVVPLFRRVCQRFGVTVASQLDAALPALLSTAIMAVAVLALQWAMSEAAPAPRLVFSIIVGGVAYCGTLLIVFRERVKALVSVLRSGRTAKVT